MHLAPSQMTYLNVGAREVRNGQNFFRIREEVPFEGSVQKRDMQAGLQRQPS
jgi:hypothetical protein